MSRSLFAFVLFLSACGTSSSTRYGDETALETVSIGYGSTDLQMVAEKMVKSMLTRFHPKEARPAIAIRKIENRSDEHIDTKTISGKIRTALLQSGKFIFTTENSKLKEALEDVEMQEDSGLYKQKGAAKKGHWTPPTYVLRGSISNIRKRNDDVEDVYFRFEMILDEVNTATTVWSEEKELRKQKERSTFGG